MTHPQLAQAEAKAFRDEFEKIATLKATLIGAAVGGLFGGARGLNREMQLRMSEEGRFPADQTAAARKARQKYLLGGVAAGAATGGALGFGLAKGVEAGHKLVDHGLMKGREVFVGAGKEVSQHLGDAYTKKLGPALEEGIDKGINKSLDKARDKARGLFWRMLTPTFGKK